MNHRADRRGLHSTNQLRVSHYYRKHFYEMHETNHETNVDTTSLDYITYPHHQIFYFRYCDYHEITQNI